MIKEVASYKKKKKNRLAAKEINFLHAVREMQL